MTRQDLTRKIEWVNKRCSLKGEPLTRSQIELLECVFADSREEKDKHEGCLDWNEYLLDQMVEHLREKYMFSSSGDAKCIFKLIEFYDKNK